MQYKACVTKPEQTINNPINTAANFFFTQPSFNPTLSFAPKYLFEQSLKAFWPYNLGEA